MYVKVKAVNVKLGDIMDIYAVHVKDINNIGYTIYDIKI